MRRKLLLLFLGLFLLAVGLSLFVFNKEPEQGPPRLVLGFTYGSEKQPWIEEVTAAFNAEGNLTADGRKIHVNAVAMGSGEAMQEALDGKQQPHLISPASRAVVELYNARAEAKGVQPLLPESRNLVLSPVVIAMWRPMAEALGWDKQPIGWAEIWKLAGDPQGWASYGHPEWGAFKFGHTHPEYSNSGLIALLAEVHAAAGKSRKLSLADVEEPKVREFVQRIEQSVVHYGSSTGFFGRQMFKNGPDYLSAVVLYENMVIESYAQPLAAPVVAVYPKEGGFWSDHPIGVVNRPWVDETHRVAANLYIDYLLAEPRQRAAMRYGFRPALPEIPLAAPFDAAHGVDPAQPQTVLPLPSGQVIEAALGLWQERKKPADLTLVIDVSGSMAEDNKIGHAKEGAVQFLGMLRDADGLSLLAFHNQLQWLVQGASGARGRQSAQSAVERLQADGGTALYDATAAAHARLRQAPASGRIAALVVLSDGADGNSRVPLEQLLKEIRFDPEHPIRIFPIAYGKGASMDVLERIAEASRGKAYKGDTQEIGAIFRDIGTFF